MKNIQIFALVFVLTLAMALLGYGVSKIEPVEPVQYENCTLATVSTGGAWDREYCYGYISNEEYEQYKNGALVTLTVKSPSEKGSEVTVPANLITNIELHADNPKAQTIPDILNSN